MSMRNNRRRFLALMSAIPFAGVASRSFAAEKQLPACSFGEKDIGNWHIEWNSTALQLTPAKSNLKAAPGYEYPKELYANTKNEKIPHKELMTVTLLFWANTHAPGKLEKGAIQVLFPRNIETKTFSYNDDEHSSKPEIQCFKKYKPPYRYSVSNNAIPGNLNLKIQIDKQTLLFDLTCKNTSQITSTDITENLFRFRMLFSDNELGDLVMKSKNIRAELIADDHVLLSRSLKTTGLVKAVTYGTPLHSEAAISLDKQECTDQLCFFTTATCGAIGLDDNCWELRQLRLFRDNTMLRNAQGHQEVQQYYAMAPDMVRLINQASNSKSIYLKMYWRYILPSSVFAYFGMNKLAYKTYRRLVNWLTQLYDDECTDCLR